MAHGTVSNYYNSGGISMSDIFIAGNDKDIEIYSMGTITIGPNVYIGNGAKVYLSPGACNN